MMRTWTLRGLAALIAVAFAVSAVRATPPETPATPDPTQEEILDRLKDIGAKLSALQLKQDVQIELMQKDIDQLKEEMRRLKDQVRQLSTTTTSVSASINPPLPTAAPVTGRINVDNRTASAAHVVINAQDYLLLPFQRMTVTTPVGPFTYEVYTDDFGVVQELTNRTLAAGRDFPILIH